MDTEAIKQQCLERLRVLYPEPWFVFWGIGAGVHCDEAMAFVRPHGETSAAIWVSDSLPLIELLGQLEQAPEANADAKIAQSSNYVADDEVRPRVVWFANGRVVRIAEDATGPYLAVGTDFHTKDTVFFDL